MTEWTDKNDWIRCCTKKCKMFIKVLEQLQLGVVISGLFLFLG